METRSGGVPPHLGLKRKPYPSPEEAKAKRAYFARGQHILAGQIEGLFERDKKVIRAEVRALIEAALDKRAAKNGEEVSPTEK